jgi:predicted nucleic acid-binding protein
MILLDTNVIIDAHYGVGNDQVRARNLISSAVTDAGAAINCITLAELYAGPRGGEEIEEDMRQAGIAVLDLPAPGSSHLWPRLQALSARPQNFGGKQRSQCTVA